MSSVSHLSQIILFAFCRAVSLDGFGVEEEGRLFSIIVHDLFGPGNFLASIRAHPFEDVLKSCMRQVGTDRLIVTKPTPAFMSSQSDENLLSAIMRFAMSATNKSAESTPLWAIKRTVSTCFLSLLSLTSRSISFITDSRIPLMNINSKGLQVLK